MEEFVLTIPLIKNNNSCTEVSSVHYNPVPNFSCQEFRLQLEIQIYEGLPHSVYYDPPVFVRCFLRSLLFKEGKMFATQYLQPLQMSRTYNTKTMVDNITRNILDKITDIILNTEEFSAHAYLVEQHVHHLYDPIHATLSRRLTSLSQRHDDTQVHFMSSGDAYSDEYLRVSNPFTQQFSNIPAYEEEAEEKAKKLLLNLLKEHEKAYYQFNNSVMFNGKYFDYKIYSGETMTEVYKDAKYLGKLCIIFKENNLPPTDSLIMRYLLLKTDEKRFIKESNKLEGMEEVLENSDLL